MAIRTELVGVVEEQGDFQLFEVRFYAWQLIYDQNSTRRVARNHGTSITG
jgi:hypothetical protein